MDNERLLKLAGVTPLNEQSNSYDAAVDAVAQHLAEIMNRVKQDTRGDFGGSQQPQEILKQIFKRIERDVAVKYTRNA